MKFIHLTDTHVIGGGRCLYGADPARRLALAVDSINAEHGDADFVIVTGDLTHWGDPAAYEAFKAQITRLRCPVHLMVGNHDKTDALAKLFPAVPRDPHGFVQFSFDTGLGRAICLDTTVDGTHAGGYCSDRLSWLADQLGDTDGPVLLFMHHPPFKTGISAMDEIMMRDAGPFYNVLAPHKSRIRHLFFGHVHRAIFGNWRGISFSCMRGLNHQVALELNTTQASIQGDLASPAYGVVLIDGVSVVVHMHDFTDASPRFSLQPPAGMEATDWALNMHHGQGTDREDTP